MSSLNFIGGEKGGVGKSVVARILAQYFIDKGQPFTGFDTDRSHASFTRFYTDYASPVVVDTFQGLDNIVAAFEDVEVPASGDAYIYGEPLEVKQPSVIVDLAAQTAAPLARWVNDSELLPLLAELNITVNLWHVCDSGKDSVDLLDRLLSTYGPGPNYIVVKNQGRGSDFSQLESSQALQNALSLGARIITLAPLQETSMNKIDRFNTSFWSAINTAGGQAGLGLLERQRVKIWLREIYKQLDLLPLE